VRGSLIVKITLPPILLVLLATLLSSDILGRLFAHTHKMHAEQRAERFADVIEAEFRREMESPHAQVEPVLKLLCRTTGKVAFVVNREHRVRLSCSDELLGATLEGSVLDGQRVAHDGTTWARRVRPIAGGAACVGCHSEPGPVGYFAVDVPLAEAETEVREQQRVNLITGGILAAILSVTLILVQVFLVYRPVRELANTVERIRAGDLAARVSTSRRDEIGRLADSLNDMAASIEHAEVELNRTHRAELAQSEKLAALGQLVSSIAHEIKNPLAGIIGALKVLESGASASDPNKPILGKILAQMERLSQTVVAALDFARPLRPAVTEVDLIDVLERTIFFIERQAAEQRVQLRKRYAPGLAHARVDPDLMKQVFLNILLNAIQAMPRGGTLEIEAQPSGAAAIEVTISDQGVGIPPENLERIFSPFFSTKERGTGLGLHVARQIVETQRGQISVTSHPGQGTSVTVRIPAEAAVAEAQAHVAD
jgi:signal transduction histidine kinase